MQQWKTVTQTFAQRLPESLTRRPRKEAQQYDSRNGDPEQNQQVTALTELNMQWWEEWDDYVNLNQVVDEELYMI